MIREKWINHTFTTCLVVIFRFLLTELHQSKYYGGARGVVVIVVGNGHGDTSSNPGRG